MGIDQHAGAAVRDIAADEGWRADRAVGTTRKIIAKHMQAAVTEATAPLLTRIEELENEWRPRDVERLKCTACVRTYGDGSQGQQILVRSLPDFEEHEHRYVCLNCGCYYAVRYKPVSVTRLPQDESMKGGAP